MRGSPSKISFLWRLPSHTSLSPRFWAESKAESRIKTLGAQVEFIGTGHAAVDVLVRRPQVIPSMPYTWLLFFDNEIMGT